MVSRGVNNIGTLLRASNGWVYVNDPTFFNTGNFSKNTKNQIIQLSKVQKGRLSSNTDNVPSQKTHQTSRPFTVPSPAKTGLGVRRTIVKKKVKSLKQLRDYIQKNPSTYGRQRPTLTLTVKGVVDSLNNLNTTAANNVAKYGTQIIESNGGVSSRELTENVPLLEKQALQVANTPVNPELETAQQYKKRGYTIYPTKTKSTLETSGPLYYRSKQLKNKTPASASRSQKNNKSVINKLINIKVVDSIRQNMASTPILRQYNTIVESIKPGIIMSSGKRQTQNLSVYTSQVNKIKILPKFKKQEAEIKNILKEGITKAYNKKKSR